MSRNGTHSIPALASNPANLLQSLHLFHGTTSVKDTVEDCITKAPGEEFGEGYSTVETSPRSAILLVHLLACPTGAVGA